MSKTTAYIQHSDRGRLRPVMKNPVLRLSRLIVLNRFGTEIKRSIFKQANLFRQYECYKTVPYHIQPNHVPMLGTFF